MRYQTDSAEQKVQRHPADSPPPRRRGAVVLLGQPTLTTAHVVAQALAIGPIVSVSLVGFLIAGTAGAAAPFVALATLLGALSLGWTVSLYARRYAGAGAVYEYVALAHGKTPGVFVAGLTALSVLVTGVPLLFLLFGLLIQGFASAHLGFEAGWWAPALAAALLVLLLVYRGVRLSVNVQLALTALSAIPFLVLAVAVIATGGADGNRADVWLPTAAGHGDVLRAFLFSVLLFAGFEAAAALGEEARLPRRSIPRAILLTISLAGAFYLIVIYAATIGFGPSETARAWGENPNALPSLADDYVGSSLAVLIEVAVIFDLFAVMVAIANAVSRLVFSLARDHLLPTVLAKRSRHETPVMAAVVVAAVAGLSLAIAASWADKFELIALLAVGNAIPGISVSLVLAVGASRFLRQQHVPYWHWIALAVAVAFPLLAGYGTFVPFPTGSRRWGIWIAAGTLAMSSLWVVFLRRRRPTAISQAADHASPGTLPSP